VLQGEVADNAVPLSDEPNREVLGDVERAVRVNGEQRIEVADADRAPLRARGSREREKKRKCLPDR
jgi:hypothetical protein